MPPRYQEWLKYLFDRPETENGWYFDLEYDNFEASDAEIIELITHVFDNCMQDLACYSDKQINQGLYYFFSNNCSDCVFTLMDDAVPIQERLRVIYSIKNLYNDCFTPRCAHVLGHINEKGANPLNQICYMLWDISPLSYWENRPNKEVFYSAIVDMLEDILNSKNPACVESALHGLGHMEAYHSQHVKKVIAGYLKRNEYAAPILKQYAEHALIGYVL
jgi:hypothetical protein